MLSRRRPIPGSYYVNLTGQLVKVRVVLYVGGAPRRVAFEYLDGSRVNVSLDEWDWLDLSCYRKWLGTRAEPAGELESEL